MPRGQVGCSLVHGRSVEAIEGRPYPLPSLSAVMPWTIWYLLEPRLLQQQSSKVALELHHSLEVKVMCHPMRRREFLVESSRAALSFSLLPLVARAPGNQKSAGLEGGTAD